MPANCPTLETLVAHSFGDPDRAIALHLATCPICGPEAARLHDTATHLRMVPPAEWVETPQCLSESAVAAFVDGKTPATERSATIEHLLSCARCRAAVASVGRMVAEHSRPGEAAPAAQRRDWWRWRIPLAAAAAAALFVFAWQQGTDQDGPSHRAPPAVAQVPAPISPIGTVAEAAALRWASVPGTDRYRVTLFDSTGRVLYETELADTVAALPDSITLTPKALYLWRAEARTGWGRWSPSELVRFSIAGGAPP